MMTRLNEAPPNMAFINLMKAHPQFKVAFRPDNIKYLEREEGGVIACFWIYEYCGLALSDWVFLFDLEYYQGRPIKEKFLPHDYGYKAFTIQGFCRVLGHYVRPVSQISQMNTPSKKSLFENLFCVLYREKYDKLGHEHLGSEAVEDDNKILLFPVEALIK